MSKLCVRCNKQINDNAMYCKYCGADQSETVRTFIPEQDYPARPDRFTRPDVPVVPAYLGRQQLEMFDLLRVFN